MTKLFSIGGAKSKNLETLLKEKNIAYELEDDSKAIIKIEQKTKTLAPILQIDENFLSYEDAMNYLKEIN